MKNRRTSKIILSPEAKALRRIRENRNLSIRYVAKKMKYSESYLRHIEKGRLDIPNLVFLNKLLSIYKVSYDEFANKVKECNNEKTSQVQIKKLVDKLNAT